MQSKFYIIHLGSQLCRCPTADGLPLGLPRDVIVTRYVECTRRLVHAWSMWPGSTRLNIASTVIPKADNREVM